MMNNVRVVVMCILVVGWFSSAYGAVLLDETFDTDLSAWNVLDTPDAGATVVVALDGSGKLDISLTASPRFRLQGIESKNRYAVPSSAGGMLIADFYGTNSGGDLGRHTNPNGVLSAFSNSTAGFFAPWLGHYARIKGWDTYNGDWAQSSALGYADLAGANLTTPYHSIITIDATNINWYIESDFYENVSSPTSLYTCATSDVFSPGELAAGLYIDVLAARYTEWYTDESVENFDGVRVTVTTVPVPITVVLLGFGALVAILSTPVIKKQES